MSKTIWQRIKSIYNVAFALYTVVVGVLFIVQVWSIYFSAENSPFSVASISAAFKQIQWFVWEWIALLAINLGLNIAIPSEKAKGKYKDYATQLKKLQSRLSDDGKFVPKTEKLRLVRLVVWAVALLAAAVAIGVSVYNVLGGYTPTLKAEIFAEHNGAAERLLVSLPWIAGALLLCVGAALCEHFTQGKEVELTKNFIAQESKRKKEGSASLFQEELRACGKLDGYEKACAQTQLRREKQKAANGEVNKKRTDKIVWIVRGVLACVGLIFVIVGICNGGMADVFEKARNICTQCIGLG